MRSVLAVFAAAWFFYNAVAFIPQGSGLVLNPAQVGGIDGNSGAVAITWAARTMCAGLVLLSLAVVEWTAILALFTRPTAAD
jgi:hypothetical protein